MKIVFGETEFNLLEKDVDLAKRLVVNFIRSVKQTGEKNHAPTLYLTTLVMMHLISKNMSDALTVDAMKILLDANVAGARKKAEQERNKRETEDLEETLAALNTADIEAVDELPSSADYETIEDDYGLDLNPEEIPEEEEEQSAEIFE